MKTVLVVIGIFIYSVVLFYIGFKSGYINGYTDVKHAMIGIMEEGRSKNESRKNIKDN